MSDPGFPAPPAEPSPTAQALWTSFALTILKLLSGAGLMGATWAAYTPEKVSAIVTLALYAVSAVMAVVSWLGSRWQHYNLARADHASSVQAAVASASATAAAGVRMPLIVVPAPTINAPNATATKPVTPVEIYAARDIIAAPTGSIPAA